MDKVDCCLARGVLHLNTITGKSRAGFCVRDKQRGLFSSWQGDADAGPLTCFGGYIHLTTVFLDDDIEADG